MTDEYVSVVCVHCYDSVEADENGDLKDGEFCDMRG